MVTQHWCSNPLWVDTAGMDGVDVTVAGVEDVGFFVDVANSARMRRMASTYILVVSDDAFYRPIVPYQGFMISDSYCVRGIYIVYRLILRGMASLAKPEISRSGLPI